MGYKGGMLIGVLLCTSCVCGQVVTSAGVPLVGAQVAFVDSQGTSGEVTTGAEGRYCFAAGQTPIPAAGPVTFTVTAAETRFAEGRGVAYQDGSKPQTPLDIQNFTTPACGQVFLPPNVSSEALGPIQSPADPNVFYTFDIVTVFRSPDCGRTWQRQQGEKLGEGARSTCRLVVIPDAHDANTLYVTVIDRRGLVGDVPFFYVTHDGGQTFSGIFKFNESELPLCTPDRLWLISPSLCGSPGVIPPCRQSPSP